MFKRKTHNIIDREVLLPQSEIGEPSHLSANNMVGEKVNDSQQTLVSAELSQSSRFTQYVAALIATVGGLISGMVLGWTSPTTLPLMHGAYNFPVSDDEISWIGGLMSVGAVFGCVVTGILLDKFGRKNFILILIIPCTLGWAFMILAKSVLMFCIGRILTGFTTGSYCIAIPIYTTEIGEKEIRGTLGTYFQLQITIGILATYVIGYFVSVYELTLICGIVPLIFGLLMSMLPESPFFYLKKGNWLNARKSLIWFRGSNYDGEPELKSIQNAIDKDNDERVPFTQAFQTTAAKRGLVIGLGVMFLQQFSGCNAVIFYTTYIFEAAGSSLEPSLSTIIIGAVSVIATLIATLVIDKLGRRILLLFSVIIMSMCTFSLGLYFYWNKHKADVSDIGWLPVTCLSVYIITFSLGFGPIPWMLMGEIFPTKIRGAASSIACLFNWSCVFVITKFFGSCVSVFGIDKTFWFYTGCSFVGIFFVFFFVPETKGKTLDEIQEMLGDHRSINQSVTDVSNIDTVNVPNTVIVKGYISKVKL